MSLPLFALVLTLACMAVFALAILPKAPNHERLVLDLLRARGESYGLDLVAASGGVLQKGVIYVGLARMEERGLIISREERDDERAAWQRPGGVRRRLYALRRNCLGPTP